MVDATNTKISFFDKWRHNSSAFFSETLREGSEIQNWILSRNGFTDLGAFGNYLGDRSRILDAGCGNGRVTALLRQLASMSAEVVGVDLVAADIARCNLEGVEGVEFYTADISCDLSHLGTFDFIYCQEVLHHTADPEGSFRNLVRSLKKGGEIAIYVYKKKAPTREFVDDYVRRHISDLSYDDAMDVCRQITALGESLAALKATVTVPSVEILGIDGGTYDVQRLVYHFFAKCFWNSELSFHENVVINYDWYHPELASRHTITEVESWFDAAGLVIVHRCEDSYGITVRGRAS